MFFREGPASGRDLRYRTREWGKEAGLSAKAVMEAVRESIAMATPDKEEAETTVTPKRKRGKSAMVKKVKKAKQVLFPA